MSLRAGSLFALSLRELLALVAIAGLGCLTLKFASDWFWIGLASAAMLLGMALLIVAVIDRGLLTRALDALNATLQEES